MSSGNYSIVLKEVCDFTEILWLFQSFHNTLKDLAGTEKTEYLSDSMNGINIGALVFSHINLKRHRSPYYSHFCFLKLGK